MAENDLNQIKVVLVEHKRTNKRLAEQLGRDQATISNGVPILHSQSLKLLYR